MKKDIVLLDSTVTCADFMGDAVGEWRSSALRTRGWLQTSAAFSNGRIATMSLCAAGNCRRRARPTAHITCTGRNAFCPFWVMFASGMLYLADYASSGKFVACLTASESALRSCGVSADGRYMASGDGKWFVKLFDNSRVDWDQGYLNESAPPWRAQGEVGAQGVFCRLV